MSHERHHDGPDRPIRVLLTKVGLDPHDRGIRLLATRLEEAGMSVIYTGPWQSTDAVVTAVVQEDPDVVGFNAYSGDHALIPKVLDRLADHGVVEETLILAGGNVPTEDHERLRAAGVDRVFPGDAQASEVVDYIREMVGGARRASP
ncbi:cobalamin B12-binding domain-containing protein [Haloglomus litoreum]|uniref:cobalamin B12-binding domain-containing protein n=1 Tax=Haloglomus litoreum TaxID=3034026 RepID=UPI0023E80A4C|nr:cobalamin-dependent protein [Haloglomus sp. DT116]